jgi:hypothetical protein
MRDTFETQRDELRTRIARSRRRFERQATLLVHNPLRLTSYASSDDRRANFWSSLSVGIGLMLSRRFTGHPRSDSWQHQLLGSAFSTAFNQLLRRLRVLAWQAKRRRGQTTTGGAND